MKRSPARAYGIHWFRRDLRLQGNPALLWNHKRHEGRVLGLFFFDSSFLARPDFSHSRFAFFLDSLQSLQRDLKKHGGDLLVLDHLPHLGFIHLVSALRKTQWGLPEALSFNRDYEPFARHRDEKVTQLLQEEFGVAVHTERDHLLIEPHELTKPTKSDRPYYQVYTPFARRWFEMLRTPEVQGRIQLSAHRPSRFNLSWSELLGTGPSSKQFSKQFDDKLQSFIELNRKKVRIQIPKAGHAEALSRLDRFTRSLDMYQAERDLPGREGTSKLGIFLKNGTLTIADLIGSLELQKQRFNTESSATTFLKELAWREFYYHILWHRPDVEQNAFIDKFKNLDWENNGVLFDSWKNGTTGYHLVDAGMRELRATGWMHNRVRMVVASFLTKDLLIDWRWGAQYFMETLLDGDLAPNNGGWQWAASTGCDAQPYFRIFNPVRQSQKFDPDGQYIKRWVPEACTAKGGVRHEPTTPVVDHAARKRMALRRYAACG